MENADREDIYLVEPRKIAELINNRDETLTSDFRLWVKNGHYFATGIDSQMPDAKLLYTGQGWNNDEDSKVDAEWVLDNIDLPEEEQAGGLDLGIKLAVM